ncbi:MAG: RNA methyltransferase [Verrucomicrobia bacterium]|nr:RNA methyltransferase [Verrucomicrobiota bacterium]
MIPRKITSLQHPLVKRLVKIRLDKEARQQEKSVLVVGLKMVEELSPVKTLIIDRPYPQLSGRQVFEATPEILKKITGLSSPEGVAAEVDLPSDADLSSAHYLLVLDGVSDPGNVGTLLRTALALGWEGVFLTPGSADPFNEKALRAAKGATFRLPLCHGTVEELKAMWKGKFYVADLQGSAPAAATPPLALILGSEAHGPSQELKKIATSVSIPMPGSMESLNVAIAGGILMYILSPPKGGK